MPAAKYKVNTEKDAQETRADIRHCVEIWNRDAGEEAITRWDVPLSTTIDGSDAILRIELRGHAIVIRCSSQRLYTENLRCCYLALDSMRMNERRGIADIVRQAYAMLEAPITARDPYEVLGVRSDADLEDIELMYKAKAGRLHPDRNAGRDTTREMAELNDAIERIRKDREA